jgi:ankyrin repeat protein
MVVEGGNEAVMKLLLETGKVDINAKDEDGRTPLSGAAERGYETVLKLLVERDKVGIDAKDGDGWTLLPPRKGTRPW